MADTDTAAGSRPLRVVGAVVALSVLALTGTSAYLVMSARGADVPRVSVFDGAEAAPSRDSERPPLRVLVASMVSPGWTLELYDKLAQQLGAAVGRRGVLVQRRNYAEANAAVAHSDVDIAFVCSGAYVQGERDDIGAQLLAVPVVRGRSTYRSYLLVPASGPSHKLEDLRGKRVTYVDPTSLTGAAYLRHRVASIGAVEGGFFARIDYSGSHDRSVEAVARGLTDGAPVDDLIYEMMAEAKPELRDKIRIIERSEPFGAPPIVVPRTTTAALRDALLKALTGMHLHPDTVPLLRALHIDRFDAVEPSHYDAVRAVWGSARR